MSSSTIPETVGASAAKEGKKTGVSFIFRLRWNSPAFIPTGLWQNNRVRKSPVAISSPSSHPPSRGSCLWPTSKVLCFLQRKQLFPQTRDKGPNLARLSLSQVMHAATPTVRANRIDRGTKIYSGGEVTSPSFRKKSVQYVVQCSCHSNPGEDPSRAAPKLMNRTRKSRMKTAFWGRDGCTRASSSSSLQFQLPRARVYVCICICMV